MIEDILTIAGKQYRSRLLVGSGKYRDLDETRDADGVHLGALDTAIAQARRVLGPGRIVGASCYGDLALAHAAAAAGASYLAFGGFYPSTVKKYDVATAPAILDAVRAELALPLVVIGGMTPANAAPLVARGADMVAAITSVYGEAAPEAAARHFRALFAQRVGR